MTTEKFGIQNLKEVAEMGIKLAAAYDAIAKDGFQPSDLTKVYSAAMSVLPAIEDIDLVDDEIADLSDEEQEEFDTFCENLFEEVGFDKTNLRDATLDFIHGAFDIVKGLKKVGVVKQFNVKFV